MTRSEFMDELRNRLERLPPGELEEALAYYEEYFDEAGPEHEQDVIREFGSPAALASRILADHAVKEAKAAPYNPKKGFSALWMVLLALFATPVAFPVIIALIIVVIAVLIVIVVVGVTAISMVIGGIASFLYGIFGLFTAPTTALILFGAAFFLWGLGKIIFVVVGAILSLLERFVNWVFNREKGVNMQGKKYGRRLLRGFALLCIGSILMAIGLSLGGERHLFGFYRDRIFTSRPGSEKDGGIISEDGFFMENGTLPEKLKYMSIKVSVASVTIRTGAAPGYTYSGFGDNNLAISASGNTFKVTDTKAFFPFRKYGKENPPTLEIILPEGVTLEGCDISIGAGVVYISDIHATEIFLQSGAGLIEGSRLSADIAKVKSGAGSINLRETDFVYSEFESGVGEIQFQGNLSRQSELKSGIGAISLELPGSETDYRFDFSRGLGELKIGDLNFSGSGNGITGNKNAGRIIKLSSALGSIKVSFSGILKETIKMLPVD
ncbi:DUF1700 domain-containing protein [Brucepastera parasyntrophica]|uniref:HAAS signaling domain-containing protein n=1 Tax=Brucepastera parasyntrophica TaxID=2880008 RepID=UPI00210D2E57|nr:DUF1700 domain-containing protein [Brucepastera parasyntrophica]ULQ59209.1 DUF1700 domain-containing protein [Brucepastera parasyntrophica]